MENKGSVVVKRRLMIPESMQEPHEENGLGLGTGVRLSDGVTVEPRGPGNMITGVKQYKRHTVDAGVNCLLQGGEPGAGVERQIDMMGGLIRKGRKKEFRGREGGGRAHTANIGRREIGYRPVDFDRERERIEGGEDARNAPSRSRTTGG